MVPARLGAKKRASRRSEHQQRLTSPHLLQENFWPASSLRDRTDFSLVRSTTPGA